MALNITDTYWEADGKSLHTYAQSIETLSGLGPPPLRGDDFIVPSSPGARWVEKIPDSNILTLAMWLRGIAPTIVARENLIVNPKPAVFAGSDWAIDGATTASITADGVTSTIGATARTGYVFSAPSRVGATQGRVYACRAKVKGTAAAGSTATVGQVRVHQRTGNLYFNPTAGPLTVPLDGVSREVAFYWKATQDIPVGSKFELSIVANGAQTNTSIIAMDEVMIEDVGTEIPTTPPLPFFYAGSAQPAQGRYTWSGISGASSSVWEVDNQGTVVSKQQYQTNWNELIRTLWTPGRQINLTKRFYDQNILRQATAKAEYQGGLKPTMLGRTAARCTVDLKLADPYFYDDNWATINLVNGDNTLLVAGNAPTHLVYVTVSGARNNAKLRNVTHGVEFTVARALTSTQTVTVGIKDYFAQQNNGGTPFDVSSDIIHAGAPQWFILRPGVNVINLSSTTGAGNVTLQYKAAWV